MLEISELEQTIIATLDEKEHLKQVVAKINDLSFDSYDVLKLVIIFIIRYGVLATNHIPKLKKLLLKRNVEERFLNVY